MGNIPDEPNHDKTHVKRRRIDWTGRRFERLVVLERDRNSSASNPRLIVRCDCGTVKSVLLGHLRRGHARSCGCLARELLKKRNQLRRGAP